MKIFPRISFYFVLLLAGLLISSSVNAVDFYSEKPDYVLTCKIYEPGFTNCSTRSTAQLFKHVFTVGIPEVTEEYGSLDPLKLDEVVYNQNDANSATIKATLSELLVSGLSKIVFKQNKISKKDFTWNTLADIPALRLEGKYAMDGKILLLPLTGSGAFFIDINGLTVLIHTATRLYDKSDFTFFNVTDVSIELKIKGIKSNFDNLFNGKSKEIERSTNQLFNENWQEFFEALRPVINETVEKILVGLFGKILAVVPANFLVEDIPNAKNL